MNTPESNAFAATPDSDMREALFRYPTMDSEGESKRMAFIRGAAHARNRAAESITLNADLAASVATKTLSNATLLAEREELKAALVAVVKKIEEGHEMHMASKRNYSGSFTEAADIARALLSRLNGKATP